MIEISPDEKILHRLLGSALEMAGAASQCEDVQVLNLACGACKEVEVVSAAALDKLGRKGSELRFVGADIRGAGISEARERARALTEKGAQVEFMEADCSKLGDHGELCREFDMVFLRHQNFWNDRKAWRKIFQNGMEHLSDSGLLVITSYFDLEHELAVKAIREAGGELISSVRNNDSRELPTPGKSVDRHLAVFRKPGRRG